YHVEKEYWVVIQGRPGDDALRRISEGMLVSDERFQPAEVQMLEIKPGQSRVSMVLREGRKREVRRLWEELGHHVLALQRVGIDGLQLRDLEVGAVRPLTSGDVPGLKCGVGS